jgi:uncharacterized protein (TIGR03000 family)
VVYAPPVTGIGGAPGGKTAEQQEIERQREIIERLKKELDSLKKQDKETRASNTASQAKAGPARVTVNLPADARLYIDGVACPLTSAKRSFTTASLPANKKFYYSVRAEVTRDGQTLVETQRVVVEAGQEATATFANFTPVATSTQR